MSASAAKRVCDDCNAEESDTEIFMMCEENKDYHCDKCVDKDVETIKKEIKEQEINPEYLKEETFWDFLDELRDKEKITVCSLCLWENSDYLQEIHNRTGGFGAYMGGW